LPKIIGDYFPEKLSYKIISIFLISVKKMIKIVSGPEGNDGKTMKAYRNLLRNFLRNNHLKPRRLYENNITIDLRHIHREWGEILGTRSEFKKLYVYGDESPDLWLS
jgi:hypothetical protein